MGAGFSLQDIEAELLSIADEQSYNLRDRLRDYARKIGVEVERRRLADPPRTEAA